MLRTLTGDEFNEIMRQARRESALKGAATRRERLWLNRLYALAGPEAGDVVRLERLYALEDSRTL